MQTIGVIGLGIIGSFWARHYNDAGVLSGSWNRTPKPGAPAWKSSPEDVVSAADVVQVVVADPPAVRALLSRMMPALGPGKTVIQSSTIDPQSSDEFRTQVMATGARYLEAPFTGSAPAAEQKQQTFFLGGEPDLVADMEPLLSLVSAARNHIGTHQQATIIKLALNVNAAAQMEALCEALVMSREAGIDDDTFFGALSKNVGYSGLTKLKEPKLRAGDFTPQFSVKHMLKDMRLATNAIGGRTLPLLDTVTTCLESTAARGYGDEDFSAVLKLLD